MRAGLRLLGAQGAMRSHCRPDSRSVRAREDYEIGRSQGRQPTMYMGPNGGNEHTNGQTRVIVLPANARPAIELLFVCNASVFDRS